MRNKLLIVAFALLTGIIANPALAQDGTSAAIAFYSRIDAPYVNLNLLSDHRAGLTLD